MKEFVPILLASDINVYSMARAFHEEYDVKSMAKELNTCIANVFLAYIIHYLINVKIKLKSLLKS